MFTTATPGLQLASMVLSATIPPWATPVPTEVGTPITGACTSPATTAGSAPSIPAATMHTRAPASSGRIDWRRCIPATPTSKWVEVGTPIASSVTAASSATGMSAVPAVMIGTNGMFLFARALRTAMRASGWIVATSANTAICSSLNLEAMRSSVVFSNICRRWALVLPGP